VIISGLNGEESSSKLTYMVLEELGFLQAVGLWESQFFTGYWQRELTIFECMAFSMAGCFIRIKKSSSKTDVTIETLLPFS
jgi:hypothetical protein